MIENKYVGKFAEAAERYEWENFRIQAHARVAGEGRLHLDPEKTEAYNSALHNLPNYAEYIFNGSVIGFAAGSSISLYDLLIKGNTSIGLHETSALVLHLTILGAYIGYKLNSYRCKSKMKGAAEDAGLEGPLRHKGKFVEVGWAHQKLEAALKNFEDSYNKVYREIELAEPHNPKQAELLYESLAYTVKAAIDILEVFAAGETNKVPEEIRYVPKREVNISSNADPLKGETTYITKLEPPSIIASYKELLL